VIAFGFTAASLVPGVFHAAFLASNRHGVQSTLNSVSCRSINSCMAVGYTGNETLVEFQSGTRWSIMPSPDRGINSGLNGLSCVSSKSCMAVGYYYTADDVSQTLIESWNGSRWSIVPSPDLGTQNSSLSGVSCFSSQSCEAVGSSGGKTLAESFDGRIWSVTRTPNLGSERSALNGVDCVSTKFCEAVGSSGSETLVERWRGKSWSIEASPTPGNYGGLADVSCPSDDWCTAVGFFSTGTGSGASILPRSLIESFKGMVWSVVPNPAPDVAYFEGVSCVSTRSCQAVGFYRGRAALDFALIESYDGTTWSSERAPSPPVGFLYGVSCATVASCEAVGQQLRQLGLLPHRILERSHLVALSSRRSLKRATTRRSPFRQSIYIGTGNHAVQAVRSDRPKLRMG
jgi:hypothetical protein